MKKKCKNICTYKIQVVSLHHQITNKTNIMKLLTITKGVRVENIDKETIDKGIIAFQLVKFEINYFGSIIETITDTWIMSDGRQIVSGGCGFIKDGYEIK